MKATTHSLIALSLILGSISPSLAYTRQTTPALKQDRKVRSLGPITSKAVEATTCTSSGFCFFDEGLDQWCITPTTPMM
jgi:hypothetical protein